MYQTKNTYECYLDDIHIICIETQNPHQDFFLVDENHQFIESNVDVKQVNKDKYHVYLQFNSTYDFRKQYFVHNNNGQRVVVKERLVTKSDVFEAQFKYDGTLGYEYTHTHTTFKLWAPISKQVYLKLTKGDTLYPMQYDHKGVYSITLQGDYEGASYTFLLYHFGSWFEVNDPYATSSLIHSGKSVVIDFNKTLQLDTYPIDDLAMIDSIIYEAHVRDFSIHPSFPFQHKGKFLGLCEEGICNDYEEPIGFDYLKYLGITHLQLLPIFDYSSVSEYDFDTSYNWGYDPEQHNVIEGRYASDPFDPYSRIHDLKTNIQHYKKNGIGIIMDVVYNHVFKVQTHVLNQIVPFYFFRLNEDATYFNGSGCGNDFASEKYMTRKFIIDSMSHLLKQYKLNGFRIDLMGLMDLETLQTLDTELRKIHPNVYIYGEGWKMNTPLKTKMATIFEAKKVNKVGFFNDQFRDFVKGSTFLKKSRGLASGNLNYRKHATNILHGYVNTLFTYSSQSINYVSCHDNQTLFDRLSQLKDINIVAYQKLCYAFILFSQGIPFLHAGCEFSRSKDGLDNTYRSPDCINQIDWNLIHFNKEFIQFVHNLILLRKRFPHFKFENSEDILNYVIVKNQNGLIYLNITHPVDTTSLLIIFNITDRIKPFKHEKHLTHINIQSDTITYEAIPNHIGQNQVMILMK